MTPLSKMTLQGHESSIFVIQAYLSEISSRTGFDGHFFGPRFFQLQRIHHRNVVVVVAAPSQPTVKEDKTRK
jgi:hypothetical protein